MMRLAEDWAREAGYAQLYLETHSNLTTAMRLYEKLGFQEIEKPSTVLHGTMEATYVMCPAALEIFVFEETKGKTGAYLEK